MNLPRIALYQPEIPHNTGTLIRLSACLGFTLEIIHPCGFVWSDKHLMRAGLDYHELSSVIHRDSYESFKQQNPPEKVWLLTPEAPTSCYDVSFDPSHVLLFGQESCGFPENVRQDYPRHLSIPMLPDRRSLNLAISVAIVAGEAWRQTQHAK